MAKKGPPKKQKKLKGGPPRKPSAYNKHVARMMKGGKTTMKQAAAAWSKRSGKPKSTRAAKSTKSKPRRVSKSYGGKKTMGKKGGFNTQKIFKLLRLAAVALPAAHIAMQPWSPQDKVKVAVRQYTGFDMATGKFTFAELAKGWGPSVGAGIATYGIPKLMGIIRSL